MASFFVYLNSFKRKIKQYFTAMPEVILLSSSDLCFSLFACYQCSEREESMHLRASDLLLAEEFLKGNFEQYRFCASIDF